MKYKTKWLAAPLAIASGLFIASSAMAATILIDFGNNTSFRGVSVPNPDPNGNFWNSMQPGLFYQNLVDTTNTATTIDFGFSTPVGTDSYNGPAGDTSNPPTASHVPNTDIDTFALGLLGVKEAAFDYAATPAPNTPARFEIQQLDPTKAYNLTFFGSHKYNTNDTTTYSVYTDNTYTTLVSSVNLFVGSGNTHNRDQVAVLTNIAPQTSNILYVQFSGAGGSGDGYLNSMSLSVVPDPSVWDGGGMNDGWSTDNNWNPNGAPANDGTAYIVFGGTVRLTPSVDVTWNVASIAFDNTAGPFTIDGPDRLTISAGGVTNNGANTQTINAAITLSANQSFTAAAGDLVLNDVNIASRALTIAGVHDVALRNVTGPGTITKTGAGVLEFAGSVGIGDIAVSADGGVTVFRESQTLSALNIGDGATVTLAATAGPLLPVPEPAAASLLLSGALALCGRRRGGWGPRAYRVAGLHE